MSNQVKPKLTHDKAFYQAQLSQNVCVVVFEKLDGTERTLIGTTKADLLPPSTGAATRAVTVPDHQVRLFDVQKKEWRSFTTDSVISFDIVPEDDQTAGDSI